MARARNIKPGLFKNEVLGVADPIYTLLFEGLWILADRDGKLEDRPLRIRGEIFPYREGLDMEALLNWLQAKGFIRRYTAAGVRCILVLEFVKHQNPHKNEAPSELPDPSQSEPDEIGTTPEFFGSTRADSLSSDSLNLIPDSLTPAPAPAPKQASDKKAPSPEFEAAWLDYPQRTGNNKAQALKAWRARIADGADPDQMHRGVKRYAAYCEANRIESRFIKLAATFFGPDRHYLSDWDAPLGRQPPTRASPAESFRERDARLARERYEEMTGRRPPSDPNTIDMPAQLALEND